MSDKHRIRWSCTEIVGIGIDNPDRIQKDEVVRTVLLPTSAKTFTIKSTVKVTKEDLHNDDPVPFFGRPGAMQEAVEKGMDEWVMDKLLKLAGEE